jgi:hypothetical protein
MGKLQTGTTQPIEFAMYNFSGGLNIRDVPQMLGDNDLTIAQDGYLTESGGFQLRNGMLPFGPAFAGGGPVYLARFFQDVQNGAIVSPETRKILAQSGSNLYVVTPTTSTLIGSIGNPVVIKPMTWARIQNPNDPHFPSGLTDCMVICTGSGGPYVYDGVNLYTPVGWINASGATTCAVVNGILYFGGMQSTPNQIFGAGDGITASMETLPAYRNFIFSSPLIGLCSSGTGATAALVIGLNDGVGILSGTGPSNYYLQETPFSDAATTARAMISYDGTIFFLGHSAIYAFGLGSVPAPISQKVEPWILDRPTTTIPTYQGFPMTSQRNLSWMSVYNNRLHLGYVSTFGAKGPDTILCYDLVLNAWTVLRPGPGCASMMLLDAPTDVNPYVALMGGTDGQVYQWDSNPATSFPSLVFDGAPPPFGGGTPVLAQVQSKFYKIGVPGTNKALQRFYPELFAAGDLDLNFVVNLNYGSTAVVNNLDIEYNSFYGIWDVSQWDVAQWAPDQLTFQYAEVQPRIDYPGTQAEAFSFGVQMTQALSPWIFAGGSGAYSQRSRT